MRFNQKNALVNNFSSLLQVLGEALQQKVTCSHTGSRPCFPALTAASANSGTSLSGSWSSLQIFFFKLPNISKLLLHLCNNHHPL